MNEHPIEGLMMTAMNSIQDMIDVNTIIGEPIEASNNIVIIPVSKVTFGFAAGGSEFCRGGILDEYAKKEREETIQYRLPFGGGSGAGVNINPIAFIVVQDKNVRLLPVSNSSAVDKLLNYVPDLMEKINSFINKTMDKKTTDTNKSSNIGDYQNLKQKVEGKIKIKNKNENENMSNKNNNDTNEDTDTFINKNSIDD